MIGFNIILQIYLVSRDKNCVTATSRAHATLVPRHDVVDLRENPEENLMRVTQLRVVVPNTEDALLALRGAFQPFASLSKAVNGTALAELMIAFANAGRENQPEIAKSIIALLWAAQNSETASIQVNNKSVSVVPSFGTQIRLIRGKKGFGVTVDFGFHGSQTRSHEILKAADSFGICFDAYSQNTLLRRENL